MKKNLLIPTILVLAFVITLALGIVIGMKLRVTPENERININPIQKGCQYNGKVYKNGDIVPADDCNTCSCEDGEISCTLMACE